MIKLLIGAKGSGKTKKLISMVNEAVSASKGSVICIEQGDHLKFDINYRCRLVNTEEYFVNDANTLYGLVAGILASNYDVSEIFIDGILRICKCEPAEIKTFVESVAKLTEAHKADIVMTVSAPVEALPEELTKYI